MRRCLLAACLLVLAAAPAAADKAEPKPVVVPFDLLATKHMVVFIRVNGKGPYRVIFDTGAPVSLLNSRVAREADLLPKNAPRPLLGFLSADQARMKTLTIGSLEARDVPVVIMDHPTVELASKFLGPIEGIIGFPFFARYRMTLDYQAKQLTFVPNGYDPPDVLQALMASLLGAAKERGSVRVLAPAALWGLVVAKEAGDEAAGVTLREVYAGSAAARAGLRPGDRLLSLDGRWTDSVADCYSAAAAIRAGRAVPVVVQRDGKTVALMVEPAPGL